jgi:hypothetical protein
MTNAMLIWEGLMKTYAHPTPDVLRGTVLVWRKVAVNGSPVERAILVVKAGLNG